MAEHADITSENVERQGKESRIGSEKRDTYREPGILELTCVCVAKSVCKSHADVSCADKGRCWRPRHASHYIDEKRANSLFWNQVAKYSAEAGHREKAERWLEKLDSTQGYELDRNAFDALLRVLVSGGNWEKAEEWFSRSDSPELHPKVGNLAPVEETFDIMVQAAADQDDLVRAERYASLAAQNNFQLNRKSLTRIILAFVRSRAARRAHAWLEYLVKSGSRGFPCYSPAVLRQEGRTLKSLQKFPPAEIYSLVSVVAKALADIGNTNKAKGWVEFIYKSGERVEDQQELWQYIRDAAPFEIVPSSLCSEVLHGVVPEDSLVPLSSVQLPCVLTGEERGYRNNVQVAQRKTISRRRWAKPCSRFHAKVARNATKVCRDGDCNDDPKIDWKCVSRPISAVSARPQPPNSSGPNRPYSSRSLRPPVNRSAYRSTGSSLAKPP